MDDSLIQSCLITKSLFDISSYSTDGTYEVTSGARFTDASGNSQDLTNSIFTVNYGPYIDSVPESVTDIQGSHYATATITTADDTEY